MTRIAVLVPCLNEAPTIAKVVGDFRRALPEAEIHVFDNNSTDGSAERARAAGARVHHVPTQGKGPVVRAMFRDVDADAYLMVDGDDTYPAARAMDLLAPVLAERAEMSVGTRLESRDTASFRPLHRFGNNLVLNVINTLFHSRLTDVMSGYRAFSRRFVKTLPVLSRGFEIETEMTLHALEHRMALVEVPIEYGPRPAGSVSKLSTFRDGYRVLRTIGVLYKDYRPMGFFGRIGLAFLFVATVASVAVILEFMEHRQVIGVARAVLAVACGVVGVVSVATGAILDTVNRRSRELYVLLSDQVVDRIKD